jgi:hypothetical protein
MQKWEYCRTSVSRKRIKGLRWGWVHDGTEVDESKLLSDFGAKGWELVSAIPEVDGDLYQGTGGLSPRGHTGSTSSARSKTDPLTAPPPGPR